MDILEKAIVLWCCTKFRMRLGKRCLLTKDGHNRQFASLCQESYCGGVCRSTLAKRAPQRLDCSTAESGIRGERFYWDNRFTMAAMQGDVDLSGPLTSSFRLFTGIYLAPNIMTGNGCEAYNILITYLLALSKIQLCVGMNGFPETWVKVLLFPKI